MDYNGGGDELCRIAGAVCEAGMRMALIKSSDKLCSGWDSISSQFKTKNNESGRWVVSVVLETKATTIYVHCTVGDNYQ